VRQRSVRALRKRINWFNQLIFGDNGKCSNFATGSWAIWLQNHQAFIAPHVPTPALLQRILSTLNSYYGLFSHANAYSLRKHLYQHELGQMKRFFLPAGADYRHLVIKAVWKNQASFHPNNSS
jgi:RNA-directed DNA polymerase